MAPYHEENSTEWLTELAGIGPAGEKASSTSSEFSTVRRSSEGLDSQPGCVGLRSRASNLVVETPRTLQFDSWVGGRRSIRFHPILILVLCAALVAISLKSKASLRPLLVEAVKLAQAKVSSDVLGTVLTLCLIHQLLVVLCVPVTPLVIVEGFLFKWWGLLIAVSSSITGSILAFALAHHRWAEPLRYYLNTSEHIRAFELLLAQRPYRYALLIRLAPLPMGIKNYGLAFLGLGVKPFLFATIISSIPWTLTQIFIGLSADDVMQALKNSHPNTSGTKVGVMIIFVGFIALLYFLLVEEYRRQLEKARRRTPSSATDESLYSIHGQSEGLSSSSPSLGSGE